MKKALGAEWIIYCQWRSDQQTSQLPAFFAHVTSSQYISNLKALDYDDNSAIWRIADFANEPNIEPVPLGNMNNTALRLRIGSQSLVLDPVEEDDDSGDVRLAMRTNILGCYSDKAAYRAGKKSDSGYSSGEPTRRQAASQAPLELFHQLGLIEYRPSGSTSTEQGSWLESNYVLIRNVYDDALWVLWRKYRIDEGSPDPHLSKEVFGRGRYAVFPGQERLDESVIYGKLAEDWDALGANVDLRLKLVVRAPSARWPEEHEGGLRRINDYRTMQARKLS